MTDSNANYSEENISKSNAEYVKLETSNPRWKVPIRGTIYDVEFEHGVISGKRVLRINGQEKFRKDWMFKLVGDDTFNLENIRCVIRVDPASGFKFKYTLFVDGKPLTQFAEQQSKILKIWETEINNVLYRIVLEHNSLNIYLNGKKREEEAEFIENGTVTRFSENNNSFIVRSQKKHDKRINMEYILTINDVQIQEKNVM